MEIAPGPNPNSESSQLVLLMRCADTVLNESIYLFLADPIVPNTTTKDIHTRTSVDAELGPAWSVGLALVTW
jgi:hypothetical protein